MDSALIGLCGGIAGVLLGYLFRRSEFRREQRLKAYTECVAAFVEVVSSGVDLYSTHLRLGETMSLAEHHDQVAPMWAEWRTKSLRFQQAYATVQIVGSQRARTAAGELDRYVTLNVLNGPPFKTKQTEEWGAEARRGPLFVAEGVPTKVAAFVDAVQPDV